MSGKLLPTYCNKCGYSTGFGGGDVCQNCKDNQSIAERVCEVLAREVEGWQENLKLNIVCYGGNLAMSDVLLRTIKKHVTHPRDWAAILSEKEEK